MQQLEANTSRLISNLDFLPTFLDLLEFDLKELNKLGIKLSGSSLIRNLKIDRTIPCLNHGALRKWSTKPYAIGFKQKLFIFHDGYYPNQEFSLFDLNDPSDKNIWPKLNQTEKLKWHELVEKENLKK